MTSLITPVREPTLCMLFNEKSGPDQVADIVSRGHAFVEFEMYETPDEQGRQAFLLLIYCETAGTDELFSMIGNKLPDYIQARRFPPSRVPDIRRAAGVS